MAVKTINILLDIGSTCNEINHEKSAVLAKQVEFLKRKFEVEKVIINFTTVYADPKIIDRVANILDLYLLPDMEIGKSFYLNGIYDFYNKEYEFVRWGFNGDKLDTFKKEVLADPNIDCAWFAVLDDDPYILNYQQFRKNRMMLLGCPNASIELVEVNHFMRIATSISNIEGVLFILDQYINSISDLSLEEIKEKQEALKEPVPKNIVCNKIRVREFSFVLESIKDNPINIDSLAEYLNEMRSILFSKAPTSEEKFYIKGILMLLYQAFFNSQNHSEANTVRKFAKTFKLQYQ